jgi:phosphoglycerate dehydrogenase-like enzyme
MVPPGGGVTVLRIHAISLAPMSDAQKQRLSAMGELVYHDAELGDAAVGELCRGAEAVVITPRLAADIVPCLDRCRFISVQGAGTDALDVAAARRKGIVVSNVPDFCTDAVAEHAFALLLAAAKKVEQGRPWLTEGRWTTALAYTTSGLSGRTLGLFGCGKIGARIAEIARGFRMRVLAAIRDSSKPHPVETVPFETLLAESDFLVLAAPATAETTGVFDRAAFARVKPGAVLVNISRAALADDTALLAALEEGRLSAAGLDVFAAEPPAPDDPLLHHSRVVVSPHVAWGTEDALRRLLDLSIGNVEAFAAGSPVNVVA